MARSSPYGPTLLALTVCLLGSSAAEARTRVEAYMGHPFGVGKITADVQPGQPIAPLGDDPFAIAERDGRIVYPVLQPSPVGNLIRDVLEIPLPRRATVYFLFRGDEPLEVTLYSPEGQQIHVVPESVRPRRYRRLLEEWWEEYTARYRRLARSGDFPLVVQNYLVTTLARRLSLPLPARGGGLFQREQVNRALGLLLGTESIRAAMQKELLLGGVATDEGGAIAGLPLPRPIRPRAVAYPDVADGVDVEPIALHVPRECIYVRFGNFRNYLWVRDLARQWGGDLANMIAVRSIDYGGSTRIEQQLALRETALAKVLGPAVIQDVAIIGTDTFVREGASVGILFHARNNFVLGNDIRRQRDEALDTWESATDATVRIGGRDVSYLSTPMGEVRSYYVQDGDFHLVTTSRYIARRFLEAGRGEGTLGTSRAYRYARSVMPTTREDAVFAYLSDAFFRMLVSPQVRVEMTRRMRSLVEIENARIAPLAARAEGLGDLDIEQLVAADFLPRGFGEHADGSELVFVDGQWGDSLRGAPGFFLPVPDVGVEAVTPREAAEYEAFRRVYQEDWQAVDPVIVTVGRRPLGENIERIAIELLVTPFHEATYGWIAGNLGPPTRLALQPVPGNVVSLEAWIRVRSLLDLAAGKRLHHVFAGLRDFRSPLVVRQGDVAWEGKPQQFIRGYVGSMPPLRLLNFLFRTRPDAVDEQGYAPPRAPGDAWQRRLGEMQVFSFKRDVLEQVTPQLRRVRAKRPAQVRLHVADLSEKAVSELVNAFGYRLARQASANATRFMNSLHQQLHVPRDQSRTVAEGLIGGTFVCPLGGEYRLLDVPGGLPVWVSTAMTPQNRWILMEVPEDYRFPLLEWFRGLSAELTLGDATLRAHIEIDVEHAAAAGGGREGGGLRLPAFSMPLGRASGNGAAPDDMPQDNIPQDDDAAASEPEP